MADTLKFGPEWLRQLSGGSSISNPPPSPAPGFGKYKLAEYRYGREEMLALCTPSEKMPEEMAEFAPIVTEKGQEPLALLQLSDEEQRILSQSVNSQAVMRMMGRGAPPSLRGRGGISLDRGRGRGRGRGDGYMQRGMSYEEAEGGFRSRGPRPDGGWEELGNRRFPGRYDEIPNPPVNKLYQRSLSNDNWRDRDEDDDDGDWRKAGSKWGSTHARGSWRESGQAQGYEYDRNAPQRGGYSRQYHRSASGSWQEEDLPEWSTEADVDEGLGTFDSSGAFVVSKTPPFQRGKRGDHDSENGNDHRPGSPVEVTPVSSHRKEKEKPPENREQEDGDISQNHTKKPDHDKKAKTTESPTPSPRPNSATAPPAKDKREAENKTKQKDVKSQRSSTPTKPPSLSSKSEAVTQGKRAEKSPLRADKKAPVPEKSPLSENISRPDSCDKSDSRVSKTSKSAKSDIPKEGKQSATVPVTRKRQKLKSEAEALDEMKETVENMVADFTTEDDMKNVTASSPPTGLSSKSTLSPPQSRPPRTRALPKDHENYSKWFYLDPQGDLQGPFTASEMAEWFSAGYFTMNLNVRRGCDEIYSPLGELIKRWGRIPFLPGTSPPPLMDTTRTSPEVSKQQQQQQQREREQQEQLGIHALQQQYLLQQQLMQQQMLMRHIQVQQLVQQLSETEPFKSLPPVKQQQLAMQMLLKQTQPVVLNPQQQQQKLSPRSQSSEAPISGSPPLTSQAPSFARSFSMPNAPPPSKDESGSIWDIEPGAMPPVITAAELEAQIKEQLNLKKVTEEQQYQKDLERQKVELRKQQEAIQRQKEQMERDRTELEQQQKRQQEIKKMEEERLKAEQEQRRLDEEVRRKADDAARRRLEEERRKEESERRRLEEVEQHHQEAERLQQEEERRQDMEKQDRQRHHDLQKQQELKRLKKEQDDLEHQQELESQRRQESHNQQDTQQETLHKQQQQEFLRKQQQQEALRKLQQDQLANMQLPSHAQWGTGQSTSPQPTQNTLLDIQKQEEIERLEQEEVQRKQAEAQRLHMLAMQQQQQQQKSWSSSIANKTVNTTKSLLEIQEEQARQLERERQKRDENQQQAAKNMSLGAASVWSSSSPPSAHWASEGAWGNAMRQSSQPANNSNNSSMGFWDDAIITASAAPAPNKKHGNKQGKQSSDFPALAGGNTKKVKPVLADTKSKPSKQRKEEEAVQRLFQTTKPEDDFTQWCEIQLRNMATSVDIPTFIAFLQDVESPYEVYDYVRSYLGESKAATDFGKSFLEKRSQFRNKSKVVEDTSIWGPAPAINPAERRQHTQHVQQPHMMADDGQKNSKGKKKKNKMMKMDASILGFTVHAAPDRMVGEIENVEVNSGIPR